MPSVLLTIADEHFERSLERRSSTSARVISKPFVCERVGQDVFFEALTLNLGVTLGYTLAFFTESTDVGTTVPNKERCGVLIKRLVSRGCSLITTTG
jgi:hypothetical protein